MQVPATVERTLLLDSSLSSSRTASQLPPKTVSLFESRFFAHILTYSLSAFDKRDPSGAGGLPIIGGALARLKGTGLSKRDDLESSELAKRQLGNLKSIPFLGSVIGGGLSMGSKRDTSKRMFLASTKLPINEGAIPIVGGYFSGEPVL